MLLSEVMPVTEVTGNAHLPSGGSTRNCAGRIELIENCSSTQVGEPVVFSGGEVETFIYQSFSITATVKIPVPAAQPDDEKWLKDAIAEALDPAFCRALVSGPISGNSWVKDPDVPSAKTIAEARTLWDTTHLGSPVLHLPPEMVPDALKNNEVRFQDGDLVTAWGDPAVTSTGYSVTDAVAFWTGVFPIFHTPIITETINSNTPRSNDQIVYGSAVAALGVTDCDFVRVDAE